MLVLVAEHVYAEATVTMSMLGVDVVSGVIWRPDSGSLSCGMLIRGAVGADVSKFPALFAALCSGLGFGVYGLAEPGRLVFSVVGHPRERLPVSKHKKRLLTVFEYLIHETRV